MVSNQPRTSSEPALNQTLGSTPLNHHPVPPFDALLIQPDATLTNCTTTRHLPCPQLKYSRWGTYMPGSHQEPNNIFPAEDCAGANATQAFGGTWGWADINCYRTAPYICEVPFPSPPPPSPSPPYASGSEYASIATEDSSPGRGSSYLWNPDDYNYAEAANACSDVGGQLVGYSSLQEQTLVEDGFREQGLFLERTTAYWMGLRVDPALGSAWPRFTWEDGTGGGLAATAACCCTCCCCA